MAPARLNPLDDVRPGNTDFVDDALLRADALVIPSEREPFWSDEARALLMGLVLYVAAEPKEAGRRTLVRVRDLISLPPGEFSHLLEGMGQSGNPFVRRAGGRMLGKADREFSSVLSTAQQNTHFLESPRLCASLERSDFSFARLGNGRTTIYLVLPVTRLATHARWLRLMLSSAIAAVAGLPARPDPPVYMLLEEMAALGKLDILENAYGLMAGLGIQLHGIAQDLTQLHALYGNRWQTFIANSGATQIFGTRDPMTAEFASKLCGSGTVESLTEDTAARRSSLFCDPDWLSRDDAIHQRPLITPDEVMTMHPAAQLLILASTNPVSAFKPAYFLDRRFRDRAGRPLYDPHPDHAETPGPPAVDFTRPGLDLGRLLSQYITTG